MRRAVLTLGGTAAALAALFFFKTPGPGDAAAGSTPAGPSAGAAPAAASPVTAPDGSAAADPSGSAGGRAGTASPASTALAPPKSPVTTPASRAPTRPVSTPARAPSSSAPAPSAKPTLSPAPATRTVTGAQEQTQYGPVQVTITVTGSKITAASGSTLGQGDQIAQNALPQLNSEAVAAQGAGIQAVSGASYTSNGYKESLQSAVDQAGL